MTTTTTRIGRTRPLARGRDAPGSHTAAQELMESGEHHKQSLQTLAALARFPFRTSKEIAREAGLERHMPGRRLPDLEKDGYAVSRKDKAQKTWTITQAGFELLKREGLR